MLVHSPMSPTQLTPRLRLNTSEAALISPGGMAWDDQCSYSADAMDVVTWNYYTLPPSPPASVSSNTDDSPHLDTKQVRPRFTPESQEDSDQQPCLPTSQVFDLEGVEALSSPSSSSPPPSMLCHLSLSSDSGTPLKKSFSMIGGTKKGRGSGERITTKDFVPPDVTGLSKREARLLKNRAAAFLSRQRKREEFEAMEIRVKELEEENSRLHTLAEKGKKYDDLLLSMEHLRLRLSMTEKRERELTVELANQTSPNVAVKTESCDLNLPPTPYSSYGVTGQASIIAIMKQSLLSSLPPLLSMPPRTSLPIAFSVPLTGSSSGRVPSSPFSHQSASCDIKDQGRPRCGPGSVGFHSSPVDVESSKKMAMGGEPEAPQFDMNGHNCLGSFAISFEASPTEDGRGCVRVQVSERNGKSAMPGSRYRSLSLASWPGPVDPSFAIGCYASPPLSAPISVPSSGGIDHLGVFAGTSNTHPRMGFDSQLMSSGYTPYAQYDPEQTFDYCPGLNLE